MSKLRRLRPSPAMVVALIALFAALGGTVYAAGHLNGKTIKKNSEPGNRIKTKSLPGNRLKNDTVTGTQVNESTLGQVPSAAKASSADSVKGETPISLKRVEATNGATKAAAETAAAPVPLFSEGALSFYGKCLHDTTADVTYSEVYAASTIDGTIVLQDSFQDGLTNSTPTFIGPATPEPNRLINSGDSDSAAANTASFADADDYPQLQAVAADGTAVEATIQYGSKDGTLPGGEQGAFGAGNVCLFWGGVSG
jgi:hypothetical protein